MTKHPAMRHRCLARDRLRVCKTPPQTISHISIGMDWPSRDGLSPMTYTVDCVYSPSRQVCQDRILRSALSAATTAQGAASRSYMPISEFSLNGADRTARVNFNHLSLMLSWSLRHARLCVLVRGCRRGLSFRRRGYKRCKSKGVAINRNPEYSTMQSCKLAFLTLVFASIASYAAPSPNVLRRSSCLCLWYWLTMPLVESR